MIQTIRAFFLRLTGADRWSPKQRKNIGEFMMLGSCLFIVPLLFLKDPGVVMKVVLQLLWALVASAGALLVFDDKKKKS